MMYSGFGKDTYEHRQLEGGIDITGKEEYYLRGDGTTSLPSTSVATIIDPLGNVITVHRNEVINELVRMQQKVDSSFTLSRIIGNDGTVSPQVELQMSMITSTVVVHNDVYITNPNPAQLKTLTRLGAVKGQLD